MPRLLHDLDGFTDRGGELLVVDTGSTDDTVFIARRHGCRVEVVKQQFDAVLEPAQAAEIQRRFAKADEGPLAPAGQRLFHFGDARQHAGLLATNAFVLQLDAGDRVLALDMDALDRWIDAAGVGAFEYNQLYGNVELRIARFYDRSQYRWEGRVHEILGAAAGAAPPIRCDTTQLLVRHLKDESKPRSYLAGLALEVIERSEKPRWWHYLGRELLYDRWYRSAIAALEEHGAMKGTWAAERSQSLCFVGECLEALGSAGEAKEAYRRAFTLDPTRREPLVRLATLCCRRGEFEDAAQAASQSLTIPRTSAYPEMEANYTWVPHSLLYWSLFWLGRRDAAREHWETYRSLVPKDRLVPEHARLFPPASVAARNASPPGAPGC